MVDLSTPVGQKIEQRLEKEHVIWLTTVDAHNAPQPRPVWFQWDGQTVLIFSQSRGAKVRHIIRNPRVALNFNTDEWGGEVGVLTGEARILETPLSEERMQTYLQKYEQDIKGLGMTIEQMQSDYPAYILVTPLAVRGF
jgi:PPOX class probable F420-dependent enzyme